MNKCLPSYHMLTQSAALVRVVRPSVRMSVTLRYRDHIGWNSSKIISRLVGVYYIDITTARRSPAVDRPSYTAYRNSHTIALYTIRCDLEWRRPCYCGTMTCVTSIGGGDFDYASFFARHGIASSYILLCWLFPCSTSGCCKLLYDSPHGMNVKIPDILPLSYHRTS